MNMARSRGYSAIAVEPASFADRTALRSIVRWAVLGAAGVIALIIALIQSTAASAATPVAYDTNCIPINFTTCVPVGGFVTTPSTAPATGSMLVSTYVDPRYCGGIVNIVNEGGNLINRCPDGTRVVPIFPDFGLGFAGGFLGSNFITGNVAGGFVNSPAFIGPSYIPPGTFDGITCNGVFGCPLGGGFVFNRNVSFLNGNICNFNFNCGNVFPAGGTVVGGAVFYNDNRFCTDGKLVFIPNRGYFCQNGGPLVPNGVTTVNCGNFFFDGCGIFRPFAAEATPAPAAATQPVTTFAAPAAKAPVAPAAVAAPAAVVAPAAPVVAKVAAPLAVTVPAAPIAPAAPVVAKVAAPAAVVAPVVDPDDHKG